MWLGFSHLFSYKCMYAGGVNFTSLLFMNVYHIYILLFWFDKKRERENFFLSLFMPLCWWFYKKGERYSLFYFIFLLYIWIDKIGEKRILSLLHMHVFFPVDIRAYMFYLCKKGRSILYLCIFVLSIHWISLLFIAIHELRGSFYEA